MNPPVVIGLTGGIASGKSEVARRLRAAGAAVVDADLLAREVVAPGTPALAEVVAAFGADVLRADGSLDRGVLGARVFADPAARARLEAITHPRIGAAAQAAIRAAAQAGARIVIYEAALLVERGLHRGLAGLVVVLVTPAVQRARLAARDGLDDAAIDARLAAQLPAEAKRAVATWVIENDGDLAALDARVAAVAAEITARWGAWSTPP